MSTARPVLAPGLAVCAAPASIARIVLIERMDLGVFQLIKLKKARPKPCVASSVNRTSIIECGTHNKSGPDPQR
jgi:hypothetical protein